MRPFLPGDIIQFFLPDDDVPPMLVIDAGETWWDEKIQLNLVEISAVYLGRSHSKVLTHRVNPELFRVTTR